MAVPTNVRGMRALAHPVRLAILTRLQPHGPATGRERWREAASRGFRFTGGGEAARALTQVMDEVAELEESIEQLLAPYVLRKDAEVPVPGARGVRILRDTMPEATE